MCVLHDDSTGNHSNRVKRAPSPHNYVVSFGGCGWGVHTPLADTPLAALIGAKPLITQDAV